MTTADRVVDAEEQPHEIAGADHLRDQIEGHHRQRSRRRRDAHRRLPQAHRDDVGEGVAPEISQRLGDEEHHDRPADEKPDRVNQPVEARERDQAGDAEKAGRAHVVAREGQPVLKAGDAAAGGVKVFRGLGSARRPIGDEQRRRDEDQESGDGGRVGLTERVPRPAFTTPSGFLRQVERLSRATSAS